MLKTNCKVVRERIRNYLMDTYDIERSGKTANNWQEFKDILNNIIYNEVIRGDSTKQNIYEYYKYWAQADPLLYYIDGSAINLLGDILEETEEERNKYSYTQAEDMLTYLITRELLK